MLMQNRCTIVVHELVDPFYAPESLGEMQREHFTVDPLAKDEPDRFVVGVIDAAAEQKLVLEGEGLDTRLIIGFRLREPGFLLPSVEDIQRVAPALRKKGKRLVTVLV